MTDWSSHVHPKAPKRLPRLCRAGPLTLDLFHRDARRDADWLRLHPREFALLWRLAETPGQAVSRTRLLSDVWRLSHDPETNRVEVHVARLRAKLSSFDLDHLIVTDPAGGYRLETVGVGGSFTFADCE